MLGSPSFTWPLYISAQLDGRVSRQRRRTLYHLRNHKRTRSAQQNSADPSGLGYAFSCNNILHISLQALHGGLVLQKCNLDNEILLHGLSSHRPNPTAAPPICISSPSWLQASPGPACYWWMNARFIFLVCQCHQARPSAPDCYRTA